MQVILIILLLIQGLVLSQFKNVITWYQQETNNIAQLFRSFKLEISKSVMLRWTVYLGIFVLLNRLIQPDSLNELLVFIFISCNFICLLFLAEFDLIYMEIPFWPALLQVIILLVVNILIFLLKLNINFDILSFDPQSNLIGGIVAAGFVAIIVIATRGKGMGEGDIILAATMGLVLGLNKLVVGFYVTIITALVYALIVGLSKKKLKGLHIPLVPFICAGTIITVLFWPEFAVLVKKLFPF